jgi:excisionase family DNA binding protein
MSIPRSLSVSQAAALCKVGRTTVGYWVRSKKVFAQREGRNYRIPVEDLIHFLKSTGQPVPPELGNGHPQRPVFRSFQNCWSFWHGRGAGHNCDACAAFRHDIRDCFRIRENGSSGCPHACRECRYYAETFLARFQFIHQFDLPAAVLKGFSLWGVNAGWAALCEAPEEVFIGMGVEKMIHPDSLPVFISLLKQMSLGEKSGGPAGRLFLNTPRRGRRETDAWVVSLHEPEGAYLIVAGPVGETCDAECA